MKDVYEQIVDSQKTRRIIGEGRNWSYFETMKIRSPSYRKKCNQCGKYFVIKILPQGCDGHFGYREYDF